MLFKRKNTTSPKSEIKPKNILHLFAPCFKSSPVTGDEDECYVKKGERKKLKLPKFPWPKFTKKNKKKKKTIPFDLQGVTSLFSASNGVSTPKASGSKRWCKKKNKTPREPPSEQVTTESTTTSINSANQITIQSTPTNTTITRPGLLRRAISRTASKHNMGRTGKLKLGAGLWVMVTGLGVMLMLGRASAVVFLCSCWYIVPMAVDGDY